MKDEFTHQKLRAVQYQHVDGSFELTFGGSLSLTAMGYWIVDKISSNNPQSSDLLAWGPLLVFFFGAVLIDRLVNALRARTTYPRTGYISPSRPHELNRTARLIIWIGIPFLTVLTLVLLFLNRSSFPAQSQGSVAYVMPVFLGLMLSGLWIIIGWKVALPRFYLIAVVSILATAALFLRGVGGWCGFAWLSGAVGASLLLSGGLTLWKYLRGNPLPAEAPDEQ